jgi:hypothetical protein
MLDRDNGSPDYAGELLVNRCFRLRLTASVCFHISLIFHLNCRNGDSIATTYQQQILQSTQLVKSFEGKVDVATNLVLSLSPDGEFEGWFVRILNFVRLQCEMPVSRRVRAPS